MENSNEEDFENEEKQQKKREKEAKIAEEKRDLLNKVLSGDIRTTRDRVGYLLNNFSETRNSDIELAWVYWQVFQSDNFDGKSITKKNLYDLARMGSLTRARAKIQNEYQLFQADEKIRKLRGDLAIEKKRESVSEKPPALPTYSVYIDETGKTQDYLSIGSLWNIDVGVLTYKVSMEINDWKKRLDINYEFHFKEVKEHKLKFYKDFFIKFLSLNPTIGFKIIIINNKGFQNIGSAITDLTFHLIDKGIQQEHDSKRAPLPRRLQVWIDEDEKGSDMLKLENLQERLRGQKIDGLLLGDFQAADSKQNYYIQAVDLFTASVNRILHRSSTSKKPKDELADYILELLNFDIENVDKENTKTDNSTVFNLSYKKIDS